MVSRLCLKPDDSFANLYLDRLPPATKRAFLTYTKMPLFKESGWYLAGGTALALQVGHRQSVDLDFFTVKPSFPELKTERTLFATNAWQTTFKEKGTLYGVFDEAKTSFIAYPFFIPKAPVLQCGTMRILPPEDLAVMKIVAISQRGRKRDFLDLYWYCCHSKEAEDAGCKKRTSLCFVRGWGKSILAQVVERTLHQYPGQENNLPHIIKSLTYFADAEEDPMPKLFFKANWKEIKEFFQKEVVRIAEKRWG